MIEPILSMRVRKVLDRPFRDGPAIYWMSRDQRASDNWALEYAKQTADEHGVPLCVVFCLTPDYLGATIRQYGFMLRGLREAEERLRSGGMGFVLLEGLPEVVLPSFLHRVGAGLLVTDLDPLRIKREWKRRVHIESDLPFHEVDAHNIVPTWIVAPRRISSYATFRARITPLLERFLNDLPPPAVPEARWEGSEAIDWQGVLDDLRIDRTVKEVHWAAPGEGAGREALGRFCQERLSAYPADSMNPLLGGQSDLSPYLHFGQLSAQRVALEVRASAAPSEAKEHYLDQLVVKRELSDNFCYHTPHYDTFRAFPKWARDSMDKHRSDPREHLYTAEELEGARTHDPLWNAAQTELVKIGKIHGSLRAYWAEKILEWSPSPEVALSVAIHLNDRYGLDARDPSGYTGIAMVMGGLYGRPWQSKEVLGKVKAMTYTEERLSYDTHAFQEKVSRL
ncbi:MAG: deoxyribodipyrimidine photo-lyase [Methanomassiliicoccus sp.]|nr:deoxyribodipyrimidine photo-lyase [Methanomassiliicoccus sp.]